MDQHTTELQSSKPTVPHLDLLDQYVLNARRGAPLHVQVYNALNSLIHEHFEDGQLFWTELAIAEKFAVSRGTVRQSLAELVRDGRLRRYHAKGSFVCKTPDRSVKIKSVGMFMAEYDSDFLNGMLQYISAACRENKVRLHVYHTHRDEHVVSICEQVEAGPEEEAILLMEVPGLTEELYDHFSIQGYRIVSMSLPNPDFLGCVVETDSRDVIAIGMEHLTSLGHRSIALVVNEPSSVLSVQEKIETFQRYCSENPDVIGTVVDCQTDLWEDSYAAAANNMSAAMENNPTALFCVSDPGAWAALAWLSDRNIRVPEAVSVLGFEDVAPSKYVQPPLTTIAHPMEELANTAVRMLLGEDAQSVRLSPTLVVRSSTGSFSA